MRNGSGRYSGRGYCTINGNNKQKVETTQMERQLSSENNEEESDEATLYGSDLDEELCDLEEPEQIVEPKSVYKTVAITVRPLLQLFSEDSRSKANATKPSAPVAPSKKTVTSTPVSTQPIVYKDICLSSDEDLPKEDEPEDVKAKSLVQSLYPKYLPRRCNWTPKSTNLLLELWEKNLKGLRGKRKNSLIHKEMAAEMTEYGISHREIKCKMDNMIKKLKMESEKIQSGNQTNWRYFKKVKALLYGPISDCNKTDRTHSDAESESSAMSEEYIPAKDLDERAEIHNAVVEKVESSPVFVNKSQQCDRNESKAETGATSDALLQIEREKLEVEKQKLQVMKHISRDLSTISKTLLELLRNTNK